MKKTLLSFSLCVCASLVLAADARPSSTFEKKYADATDDQIREAFNTLSAASIINGRGLAERRQVLEAVAFDSSVTSPEIEAARKRIAEIDAEMMKARQALRVALEQHPEVKSRRSELDRDARKHEDNAAEIDYLRKRLLEIRTRRN